MRLTILAIIALAAAAPAVAQNESVDPATTGAANTVDANAVAPTPADPATAVAPAPAVADPDLGAETDIPAADDGDDHDRGFPWGLIGLVGLVGLLGRRRSD